MNTEFKNYEKELEELKIKLEALDTSQQKALTRVDFSILLAAFHSILSNIKLVGLSPADSPNIEMIKDHLKNVVGIADKQSAIRYLSHIRNFGCGRKYRDFLTFWEEEEEPAIDLEKLDDESKQVVEELKDYAYQFYPVLEEKGFAAWDIGECIHLVREIYTCGYIEEELSYEIIYDFTNMALDIYENWVDYALSYLAGACYFTYENTRNQEYIEQMFQNITGAIDRLFFQTGTDILGQYAWFVEKDYFAEIGKPEELVKEKVACLATDRISMDGCPIRYMERQEPNPNYADSGWRFLAGDETPEYLQDATNTGVFGLNLLANYDRDIVALLDSEVGSVFVRDQDGMFIPLEE